jgi:hypothetical protein
VPEPVAALDRYTHQALMTGLVDLPGRTVHASVWFRLLRSLLNELALPTSALNRTGKATVATVWKAMDLPERAGLAAWRSYEHLTWETQETLLRAAATVLRLAADTRITPAGVYAQALVPAPHRPVYEGDRPQPDLPALAEFSDASTFRVLPVIGGGIRWRAPRGRSGRTAATPPGEPGLLYVGLMRWGRLWTRSGGSDCRDLSHESHRHRWYLV